MKEPVSRYAASAALAWAFAGFLPPYDVNDDGVVNPADVFCLVNHFYSGGPPPLGIAADLIALSDAAVSSATLVRAGLLAGRTPIFETTATGPGTISWVGSFDEAAGAIPCTQPPGAGGDAILVLSMTLSLGPPVALPIEESGAPLIPTLGGLALAALALAVASPGALLIRHA